MKGLRIECPSERYYLSFVDANTSAVKCRSGRVVVEVRGAMISHTPDYRSTDYQTLTTSQMSYRNTSICLRACKGCCDASADGTDRPRANKCSSVAHSNLTGPPTSPRSGTGRRARKRLGEFCGSSQQAPPTQEDPAHRQAHHTVSGRESGREGRQGGTGDGHRGRAGRGAAGARRREESREGHHGDRASAHRSTGKANPPGQPQLHRPPGRHAVRDRAALLRQPGRLAVAVPRERVRSG